MNVAIAIDDVSLRLGHTTVLSNISLTIASGEILALLGPSGCGKTTLVRLMCGLLAPDDGTIWFGEERVSAPGRILRPPGARKLRVVSKDLALWPQVQLRTELARAVAGVMVLDPWTILFDEPLSDFDASSRSETLHQIRSQLKAYSVTGIYLTRHAREAVAVADRIAVMLGGHIVANGWPTSPLTR